MSIQDQVRLSPRVAFDVVSQGIRIRLGRSVITLMGVVLGIAFLMSMLTSQVIREDVSQEEAARVEVGRMLSFLTGEMGPVRDRVIGVVQAGPLNDEETRLVRRLVAERAARINWYAAMPELRASVAADSVRSVPADQLGVDASAIIVMGAGGLPALDWESVFRAARLKVLAFARRIDAGPVGPSVATVHLERELKEDEATRIAAERRRSRFRTVWIVVISLLVTVIGISNAMLMSVTERFREIGTMKCLGALSRFIRQIFFIESSLMGLSGSIAGCLLGFFFALMAYSLTYGFGLVIGSLNVGQLLLYALFSIVAGIVLAIIAAIYPANFASRMVPANALRSTV